MSFQAMTWAVEQKLPALQKLVLLMLANRTNHETGVCIPKIKTLADECGMSETACKNAIKALEGAGAIRIEQRFNDGMQRPNQYHLLMNAAGRNAPTARRQTTTARRVTSPREAGDAPGVGRETPTEPGSKEPGIEPDAQERVSSSNGQTDEQAKRMRASDLIADGIDADLARDFLQHRKTKKAPLTERAYAGIKREASKAGWNLTDALTKAIERNWVGFEAEWVAKAQGGQKNAATGPSGGQDGDWWESATEIERRAAETGVKRKQGEDFQWFKCRVAKALKERRWMDLIIADLARTKNQHYAAVYQYFNGTPPMEGI